MMEFETICLSPALGAEIRGLDLSCPLNGETIAALRSWKPCSIPWSARNSSTSMSGARAIW